VFNSSTLVQFGDRHGNARSAFRELNRTLRHAEWGSFQDVATAYPAARAIGADRIIFNVKGNQFRVVAAVDYARRAIFIKFVGTHAEYDRIDAATVNDY
jgi:mRNA interferase HigB